MSELYLSDVTLRESRPRSRRLRDLGYVVRSYPETAPVSTASSSILDTILIPHYDDAGNLVSLESTVDFWSEKMISAGGLAAAGGGGNVNADSNLIGGAIIIGKGDKNIEASRNSLHTGYDLENAGDDTVPVTKAIRDYVSSHGGGGLTWVDLGTNATKKKIYGTFIKLSEDGTLGVDEFGGLRVESGGGGGSYTLPIATASRLGGIKVGSGLLMASDGTLSAPGGGGDGVSQDYVDSHIAGRDVVSTTPTNGQTIVWDATNNRFKFQTISGGGGGTSGITEDYANDRYIRRDGTTTGDEKITFVKGIRIGSSSAGVDITYDTANGAVKINGKAYTVEDFSGGGLASGSGDSGVDIITSLSASSTNDQVLGARALYNILGDLESALTNLL